MDNSVHGRNNNRITKSNHLGLGVIQIILVTIHQTKDMIFIFIL